MMTWQDIFPKKIYPLFYGIEGVYFIYHNEWADPEIEYKGNRYNYYDLEDMLCSIWEEEVAEGDCKQSFDDYVRSDPDMVYGCLDDMEFARIESEAI